MCKFIIIFLFFFSFLSAKADTIYNLIKIPNLKIYEINTKNKIKYFYAAGGFRLGVEKNIECFSSDVNSLSSKYQIIHRNLSKYSSNFLKKINLKYIVMCENLSISGTSTAGIPNNVMKTLIIDIKFNKNYFERSIHHEIFHMINDSFNDIFDEEAWKRLNKKKFKYAKCSTCTDKINLSTYNKTEGFFTEYSKSTASEDMAEVFSYLMFDKNIVKEKIINDNILEKKVFFLKKNILKIDSKFEFDD